MADFSRPASGFRFKNLGMKANSAPDALPEFKYPYLQNIRGYLDAAITSRPQISPNIAAPGGLLNGPVVALEPTLGVYKINSSVFVNGSAVDSGYQTGVPCSIVPFRPNASPNAYDYVFDDAKGGKVFVPSLGPVVAQKIGIAEPQSPPDICPDYFLFTPADAVAAAYTQSGVAGAPTDITRSTEAVILSFNDPASLPSFGLVDPRCSLQVGTTQKYSIGETVNIAGGGGTENCVVQDVIPPTTASLQITAIRYIAGATGRCVITTSIVGQTGGIIQFAGNDPSALPSLLQSFLTSFRRGAIMPLTGGVSENVMLLNATLGPQGALCLETITGSNHAVGENIVVAPTLVLDVANNRTGQTIKSSGIQTVTTGAGTGNLDVSNNTLLAVFFGNFNGSSTPSNINPRIDDYIHLSVNVSDLTQLTSIRIYFDVDSATNDFAHNAYYFEIQPNDLTQAVAGTQTQLGGASVAVQRQAIRSNIGDISRPHATVSLTPGGPEVGIVQDGVDGTGFGSAGEETTLGVSQWSEIFFPISALTRIGNDQTRTLSNIVKIRLQVVCTAAITVQFSSIWLGGGNPPDTGTGLPYLYRIRGRSSVTGARGNPSPSTRYGVLARRQNITVKLPSAAYDTQIDIWDVFRFGGQVNSWRYAGSGAPNTVFQDNLFDSSIISSEPLSFDQHEPFPGIGPPVTTNTATVIGTQMIATFPLATVAAGASGFGTLSQIGNLLPGTQINIANNLFTLWNRPVFISATAATQTWLFQLQENAGAQTNPSVIIEEPALANQNTNNVWGPDSNGVMFSVMAGTANNGGVNGLRPGVIQWTNPNDPDAASDMNTRDLCPTSEPLQNGEMLGPTPVVFSANRSWRGFPRNDGSYNWVPIPTGAGLAAQFAICSDGEFIYFVAKDGIRKTAGGDSPSLTDEDLYNIFPHEGVQGKNVVYAGMTIFAPDYTYAGNFQLNVVNRYLYFDYQDSNKVQRTLVCDLRTVSWTLDIYSPNPVTIHAGVTVPYSTQNAGLSVINKQLFMGDSSGAIYSEVLNPVAGAGEQVSCVVITREEMMGDIRSSKILGDAILDALVAGGPLTVSPILFGAVFIPATVLAGAQVARPQLPYIVSLGGQQIARSIALEMSWIDQGASSQLLSWQPNYINQPEDTTSRFTDWDDAGTPGAKFFQGFILEADTGNNIKNISIRSADDLLAKALFQIQHNGQQEKAYSFAVPFVAHMVRIEPDNVLWRMFKVRWITQPTPEAALNWITQPTSHGLQGYQHVPQMMFAYNAPSPVIFTLTVDGLPIAVNLPATAGYIKLLVKFPANKGLVFQYAAVSVSQFQVWEEDIEIFVGEHGRGGPYKIIRLMGGQLGAKASI